MIPNQLQFISPGDQLYGYVLQRHNLGQIYQPYWNNHKQGNSKRSPKPDADPNPNPDPDLNALRGTRNARFHQCLYSPVSCFR